MKKSLLLGSIAVVFILVIVVVILLLNNNNDKITISFDTGEAKGVSEIEIDKGESIKLPNIEKNGYALDGWYLNDERVTDTTVFDKNVTLKAKWIKKFTVTFNLDDGTKIESVSILEGEQLKLPLAPSKIGHTCRWNSEIDGSGTNYDSESLYVPNSTEVTMYVNCTTNTYTINYVLNGGKKGLKAPSSGLHGEILEISDPIRTGYVFTGWKLSGTGALLNQKNFQEVLLLLK